ncbi:hypothetical protein HYH03_002747 [Edaphochlamys debaryana]|uniref:Uncharacterized protein n=1 Tax=Edaphochlamys debaryana TaxID=47281 RepID=A0A836C3J4_9CHLO|nr:hypothetical protein HYH03_002747 [Edaphochlamys debaryana]|eukprot:KAG2499166.1 hypothetical protein HYH03_002747 [Edaphochlamys debaryana]
MLEVDRLLWSFRKTAGLPTPGQPYIVSWEDPGCELRGHFVGHYLSALSLAYAGTGNPAFKQRLSTMVSELAKCQQALGLGGYLSAFPTELFDRVEALQPVWAPYYTIHKIIAGMVDAYEMGGEADGLEIAKRMVAYHWKRTQTVVSSKGREHWTDVLNCEYGGMNEILYRMYRITKDPTHLEFAKLFDKPAFKVNMNDGNDVLPGLHANTHLAQIAGFAEAFDAAGDEVAKLSTENFFNMVVYHHSFATGGSNDHEFWSAPDELGSSIWLQKDALETQETCTQYNMLKIARSLFRWTGEVKYADYYERALLNGILGTARLPAEDWPEHAVPHRHGDSAHHHHHHHVDHLRRSLVGAGAGAQQGKAVQAGGSGGAAEVALPHSRQHNEEWLNWWVLEAWGRGDGVGGEAGRDGVGGEAGRDGVGGEAGRDGVGGEAGRDGVGGEAGRDGVGGEAGRDGVGGEAGRDGVGGEAGRDGVGGEAGRDGVGGEAGRDGVGGEAGRDGVGGEAGRDGVGGEAGRDGVGGEAGRDGVGGEAGRDGGWAFAKPQPQWNASDAHGPGVFLYLLPMGTGQSKSDNIHHWGFPFHSFWCCYGTVIESYAKLADSIYFKDMQPQGGDSGSGVALSPRLYINQLVSSKLTWKELGVKLTMEADMHAPGPAATAVLRFDAPKATGFTLMVRIPEWVAAAAQDGTGGAELQVNGVRWASCPGPPKDSSYCQIAREWLAGDSVSIRLPMAWGFKPLPENRPQYRSLMAVMMGPFVMAGITHQERILRLPGGANGGVSEDLAARVYPPEEADELLSIQATWNASLHLRHDNNIAFVSELAADGGDKLDATFRLSRSCHHEGRQQAHTTATAAHHGLLSVLHGQEDEEEGASPKHTHGALVSAFASLRSLMRLGQHDSGSLSLEAMSYPNHYLAFDQSDVIVLQPGSATVSAEGASASCSNAMWMMRPGLDGASDTVSFEAMARPGWFITAQQPVGADHACADAPTAAATCADQSATGPCNVGGYGARVLCRKTCGVCNATASALRLRERPAPAASSFRLAPAARRAYPAGSYVLAGSNRHFLLAPLGNLVDERYTAYFDIKSL